jgi:hypothetical protein
MIKDDTLQLLRDRDWLLNSKLAYEHQAHKTKNRLKRVELNQKIHKIIVRLNEINTKLGDKNVRYN